MNFMVCFRCCIYNNALSTFVTLCYDIFVEYTNINNGLRTLK